MNPNELKKLLEEIGSGRLSVDEGMERLATLPYEDLGVARLDHHRHLRQGTPEMILGASKTAEQMLTIVAAMVRRGSNVLITRLDA